LVVPNPAPKEFYREVLEDPEIKPAVIGGMWYNTPYVAGKHEVQGRRVVLHFHGGAYVVGGYRPKEGGIWGPGNLAKRFGAFVFCPQYRLSSLPNGRFPAALQDAVTSYKFLLDLGIPASSIILSGDS
jgi:acetyl esterase/lipase